MPKCTKMQYAGSRSRIWILLMWMLYKTPCEHTSYLLTLTNHAYAFARASTDFMHCLPEVTVKSVLEHRDGLCIDFAIMETWSRVRGT